MRESGITNKNTAHNAIKILEAYDIIVVLHSNGRTSNEYALLDSSKWKPVNSTNLATVLKKDTPANCIKNNSQQRQNISSNSITGDTRSHISKSYKLNLQI